MTNRDWFTLALRVLGVWQLMALTENYTHALSYLLNPGQGFESYMLYSYLSLAMQTGVSIIVVLFAPAFAKRLYPEESLRSLHANIGDCAVALRVGLQLIGVYALLLAVQRFAGGLLGSLVARISGPYHFGLDQPVDVVGFGLYFLFGLALIIYNDAIIRMLERMRYVAERDAYENP